MQCFTSTQTTGPEKLCQYLRREGKGAWEHGFCARSSVNNRKYGTCGGDSGGK